MTTYTCACCQQEFDSETSVEDADEDSLLYYGVAHGDPEGATVCEPCWLAGLEETGN